jgi:hypothetical protein
LIAHAVKFTRSLHWHQAYAIVQPGLAKNLSQRRGPGLRHSPLEATDRELTNSLPGQIVHRRCAALWDIQVRGRHNSEQLRVMMKISIGSCKKMLDEITLLLAPLVAVGVVAVRVLLALGSSREHPSICLKVHSHAGIAPGPLLEPLEPLTVCLRVYLQTSQAHRYRGLMERQRRLWGPSGTLQAFSRN